MYIILYTGRGVSLLIREEWTGGVAWMRKAYNIVYRKGSLFINKGGVDGWCSMDEACI